jgi:MoxR-like ATPase
MVASQAPPGNLPLQPTSLIGRDQEVVEIAGALTKTRLLTLTGVGGVGKTRLALAVAERLSGHCGIDVGRLRRLVLE